MPGSFFPRWDFIMNFLKCSSITPWLPTRQTQSEGEGTNRAQPIFERLPGSGNANRRQTDMMPIRQEESGEDRRPSGADLQICCEQSRNNMAHSGAKPDIGRVVGGGAGSGLCEGGDVVIRWTVICGS